MVDLSDFVAHSPNVKRGDIPAEQRRKLNDVLEDLNPDLYGADTGKIGGGGNNIPTAGLVSYWPLDDLGDGTAADYVGQNHGTLRDGVGSTDGKQDGAAVFDGVDDVIVTDLNVGEAGQSFTVAGFLRAPAGQDFGQNHFFLSNYVDRPHDGFFAIGSGDADEMYFRVRNTDRSVDVETAGFEPAFDGQFHHYVGVRDADADEMRFHIDGSKKTTKSFPGDVAVRDDDSFFGMMQHFDTRNMSEIVDDVRVYDRVLSDNEVTTLFEATNTPGRT
jgi:hypothetical protein